MLELDLWHLADVDLKRTCPGKTDVLVRLDPSITQGDVLRLTVPCAALADPQITHGHSF